MNCEYCGASLKTLSSLKLHQKTAKYCLSQQNITTIEEHSCRSCSKKFNRKSCLDNHLKICKENSFENELRVKYENREKELISLYEKDRIIQEKDRIIQEKDRIIQEQKLIIEEQKLIIKEFQDDQRKQNKDLNNRIQSMAEKAIERKWETIVEIEEDIHEEPTDEPYELVPLELDNGYIIESRDSDGYIDVTNLCTAGKKKFNDWNRLDKTKAFLKELSSSAGIPALELITQNTGGNGNRHTWVHPQVAINIAQWISPQFDVKVSAWVLEVMMTGKLDITNTKSYRELQQDNKNKQLKIQLMTKKYVKKQPRTQYDKRNVVYILTTANMKKERRYILGKATNLTSRLSVYNKSDEHEVVYYQECLNEEKMGLVECFVFYKLNEYREQANRERFLLPEGTNIDLFSDTIRECINFIK